MKKEIDREEIFKSVFCLQPTRPILCTTKNEDATDHVAPFSWCVPISTKPPMLALSLLQTPKKSHSLSNIERTKEFVINLPDMSLIDDIVLTSYKTKYGENKFDRSKFTKMKSKYVKPVCIKECRAHLECKAESIIYPGDHALIIANIINAVYDDDAFSDNMLINFRNYKPVIHMHNYPLENMNSQIHVFLNPVGEIITEVMYPTKKEQI